MEFYLVAKNRNEAGMRSAVTRISLVFFLTVAMSYQSWLITVPAERNHCFSPAPPDSGKVVSSLIDIDDEHRATRASFTAFPVGSFACALSFVLEHPHSDFGLNSQLDSRPIQKMRVVLLI
jgi:hypothetical protein